MNEESCFEKYWKARFKAVENFLRKVAFNLGNTPSQTEVKIISCIPIDVTDLQRKIFLLQKELNEAKNSETINNCRNPCARTAVCENICDSCIANHCRNPSIKVSEEDLPHTSTISIHCEDSSSDNSSNKQKKHSCPESTSQARGICNNSAAHIKLETTEKPCKTRNIFSKKKKLCQKKCKSQFIYRAQTETNTPFRNSFRLSNDVNSKKDYNSRGPKTGDLSRSYLECMAQKHFKPQLFLNTFSNISEFSFPSCRDHNPNCLQNIPYESDLCSCCHAQFQNIDKYMNNENKLNTYPTCETFGNYNKSMYYDSKFYDLVPVKENTVNIRKNIETKNKTQAKKPPTRCWPDKLRPKYRIPSTAVNYCTVPAARDRSMKRNPHTKSQNKKDNVMNKMAATQVKLNPPGLETDDVDFGPVYIKHVTNQRKQKMFPSSSKMCNVPTCLSTSLTNADCQTANTNYESPGTPSGDRTEMTLNQIKDILQSVLTEVKTGGKLGTHVELPKKNATVQNGPSQSNVYGASQFLRSFTYSPYNMSPYMASCSHQISSNTYPECTGLQGTHLQQYPLLIQPQKPMCTNCLRNTHVTKSVNTRLAASTATNTEQTHERNKETERLIKEIYNSMALNVEIPSSKDNVESIKTKKSANMDKMKGDKNSKRITNAISELFRNKYTQDSTTTTDTATTVTLVSNMDANEAKFGSERVVKRKPITKSMYCHTNNSTTETMDEEETEQICRNLETEEKSAAVFTDKDTEQSSSVTDTDDVVVQIEESVKDVKKQKDSIFKKMLKMFQPKQRSRRKVYKEVQNDSESDSGDYQTVCCHRTAATKPKQVTAVRSRPRSKVLFYSKQPQQKCRTNSPEKNSRNSPYMEQEYRRYWDEKLMFHQNQRKRYSTDASISDHRRREPVYYQNYEARSVLVEPIGQAPLNAQAQQTANNYTRNNDSSDKNRANIPGDRHIHFRNSQNLQRKKNRKISNSRVKPHFIISKSSSQRKNTTSAKLAWMKKHNCGHFRKESIRCS